MYCKHCGKEISEDSRYCNYCGKEVVVESEYNSIPKEVIQRTIDAITKYDWNESIELAKKRYPKADAIKFRVCFYTDTFDLNRDYNNFLCLDSEDDVKDSIVKYLRNLKEGCVRTTDEYDLDIYVSTDAFISKDHDENEGVFDVHDIFDGNIFNDEDGNSWISTNCLLWCLGCDEPMDTFWNEALGHNPANMIRIEESNPYVLQRSWTIPSEAKHK